MQDNLLIKLCKQADPKAQRKLYDQYSSMWFMIALRYMNSRADALDVLQNALIKIYSKIDQFNPALGNFKSWSSKVVVNEAIMLLRKNKSSFDIAPLDTEAFRILDRSESAVDHLSAEELTEKIQEMPEGYRVVFNMYAIEGYSHKEISETLNISVGTSKSQFFKARNFLKKQIELVL